MLSPSMKFQNHILNFEQRMGAQTSPKQYAPSTLSLLPLQLFQSWGHNKKGTAEIKEYQHCQPPGSNQQPFHSQSNALPTEMGKKIFTLIRSFFLFIWTYESVITLAADDNFFTNLKYFLVKIKLDNSCESSALNHLP